MLHAESGHVVTMLCFCFMIRTKSIHILIKKIYFEVFYRYGEVCFIWTFVWQRKLQSAGASKNPSGTSQIAVVLEIWPPEVLISLENMREGQTKIVIFSNLVFRLLESPK